jgi:hypothetical protein
MKAYTRYMATGAMLLGLGGCGIDMTEHNMALEGTVVREFGTLVNKSDNGQYSNEQTYGLVIRNEKGEFIIGIDQTGVKPLFVLEESIKPGDRVKISSAYINNDNTGTANSNLVEKVRSEKAEKQ